MNLILLPGLVIASHLAHRNGFLSHMEEVPQGRVFMGTVIQGGTIYFEKVEGQVNLKVEKGPPNFNYFKFDSAKNVPIFMGQNELHPFQADDRIILIETSGDFESKHVEIKSKMPLDDFVKIVATQYPSAEISSWPIYARDEGVVTQGKSLLVILVLLAMAFIIFLGYK